MQMSFLYLGKNLIKQGRILLKSYRSGHTSANQIFHFSDKKGKRKYLYYLSLSYLHILKNRKK